MIFAGRRRIMAPLDTKRFGRTQRLGMIAAGVVGLLTLGGCATDGYGYGGMDVGVGYGGGYGGYYDPYYGPAGYYGGWYNDYYYPGGGYYVYDRGGRRHRWNDGQRAYWQQHRGTHQGNPGDRPPPGVRPSREGQQYHRRPSQAQGDPGNGQPPPSIERSQGRSVAPASAPRQPSADGRDGGGRGGDRQRTPRPRR
jgi:hypothetical protein